MLKVQAYGQAMGLVCINPVHTFGTEVGAIVVIQTRWSENDMIGQLLESEENVSEKGRENWTIVDLPALFEDEGSRPALPEH